MECETIDSFCRSNSIDRIGLLKIDVEGAHFQVLEGASQMLSEGRVDVTICEGGPNTFEISGKTDIELFDLMRHVGLVPYYVADKELVQVDEAKQHSGLVDYVFLPKSWNHMQTRRTQPTG